VICKGEILKNPDSNSVGSAKKNMSELTKHELILKSEDHIHINKNKKCMYDYNKNYH
jgi:hypothetical protein